MNVSPNELRKEAVKTLKEVNSMIELVEQEANGRHIRPQNELMASLLLAKAQCLQTLTLLNEKR